MKKMLLVVAIVLIAGALQSQTADFRAAEKFSSQNLTPKIGDISVNARWIEESDIFWYSYKTTVSKNYYYVDAAKKTKNLLFDSRYLAAEIHKLVHKPYNELDLPLRSLEFEKKSTTKFTFELDSVRFLYDMTTMQLTIKDTLKREPRTPSWISYSPDSLWIVFARNHNLFVMKKGDKDSTEIQLTTDGVPYYSFAADAADTTTTKRVRARASWFKNSGKFYVMRSDVRKVKDLYVIDVLAQPRPKLETYRYAMPGEEFVPQPELVVFDPAAVSRVDVDLKKWKDQTISVAWTSQKSADKMIVIRKDRALKNLEVCSVNSNTGEVKVLFSDQIHPYFNNDYSQLSVLNEGNDIIYWSEKTGWGQLYLYDGNGTLKNQITNGYFVTGRIERIDTLGRMIYFEGFGREQGIHPYYSIKYKASIDRGGMVQLTKEPASHSFSMSRSNKFFVSTYSTVDKAPKSVLRDNNGNILLELETTDLTELYKTGWKEPETIVLKAKDGVTNLYGVMYKPFNFDPTKKYPVISYVYPGPQTESVPYTFTVSGGYNVALAQLGFIIVNFGHRGGSPMRSHYYHSFGYDNLRDYALTDDRYGIEQLADMHSYIDVTRVGIYGHSGGGFMSTAAILGHPDFYDVAVSSAGNHDNNIYNQWWGETHHGVTEVEKKVKVKVGEEEKKDDLKEEKKEMKEEIQITFKANIPKNQDLAKNLRGHLLLVHGDIDNNVHPGNTLRVVDALVKAEKRFDLMMLPGQRHGFGTATPYFERMMWYYFAEHLLGDYRNNVDLKDYMNY